MINTMYIPLRIAEELALELKNGDIVDIHYKCSPDCKQFNPCEVEVIDNETVVSMEQDCYYTRLVIKSGTQYFISSIIYSNPYKESRGYDIIKYYCTNPDELIKFVEVKRIKKTVYDYIPVRVCE